MDGVSLNTSASVVLTRANGLCLLKS